MTKPARGKSTAISTLTWDNSHWNGFEKGRFYMLTGTPTGNPKTCNQATQSLDDEVWVDLSDATGNDVSLFASVPVDYKFAGSSLLILTDFGFSGLTAPITGIQVKVWTHAIQNGTAPVSDCVNGTLMLTKTGGATPAPGCTNKATNAALGADQIISAGGDGDLWGSFWTPAEIEASGFGVLFRCENYGRKTGLEGRVKKVEVEIWHSP